MERPSAVVQALELYTEEPEHHRFLGGWQRAKRTFEAGDADGPFHRAEVWTSAHANRRSEQNIRQR